MDLPRDISPITKHPQPHSPRIIRYNNPNTLSYIVDKIQGAYFHLRFRLEFSLGTPALSDDAMSHQMWKPPAHLNPSREPQKNNKTTAKSAMKLPTAEHSSPVVRAMQRAKEESRRPSQSKSTSAQKSEEGGKRKGSHAGQSGGSREKKKKPVAAVNWQPPKTLMVEKKSESRRASMLSSLLSGSWYSWEKKAVTLAKAHRAADTTMDELDGMFKPTLEELMGSDGEEDDSEDEN